MGLLRPRYEVGIVPLFLVGLLALNLFKGLGNLEVILLNFTRVNASTRTTHKQQALKKGFPFLREISEPFLYEN